MTTTTDREQKWAPDLYKKFFKTKTAGGFLALRPWLEAGKLAIDIGEVNPTGGLASNTLVWAPALSLAAYLRSVANGTAERAYPADSRKNLDEPEGYIYYGGSNTDSGPVSRILKISHWYKSEGDAFEWKTGQFHASSTEAGAFVPNLSAPISQNKIKITRAEMGEIALITDLALGAFSHSDPNWVEALTGKINR